MALTTNSRSPAFTSAPSRALMSTTEPACGLSTASCPGGTGNGRAGGGAGTAAAPQARDLLVEELQRSCLRLRRGSIASASSVVRALPARNVGMRQDRAQLVAGWSAGRRCGTRPARGACGRRRSRSSPRSRTGRSAWPAADRTAAAAPARHSRRHRRARRGRTAPVGAERAGALRHDARLHGEAARRADRLLVGEPERRRATRRRRCGTGPRRGRSP